MEDRLRRHIENLFEGTSPTRNIIDFKEELLQNLREKYADLIREGKSEDEAYHIVIAGIGDVTGLIKSMEENEMNDINLETLEKQRQKSALLTAGAVMLYILSIVPVFILEEIGVSLIPGVIFMFLCIAIATGMLIYNAMTKPKYIRANDSMVEEFKEWQNGKTSYKSLRRAISGALWSIITALYFIISFTTMGWHLTWVIFIIGFAIEAIISIFFTLKN